MCLRKIIAASILAFLLVSQGIFIPAQQCIGDLSGFKIGTRLPGPDGLIHITYRFVDEYGNSTTPPPDVLNALNAGITQWNNQTGTTGIVLEPAQPGAFADLEFQPDAARSGPCAGYIPERDRIYYHPTAFTEAAQQRPDYAAGIVAHEIGHFLGLDEGGEYPSPPTVMNNPTVLAGQTCKDFFVPTQEVQPNDAQKVPTCVSEARQQSTQTASYEYSEPNYSYTPACYTYYEVTDYYLCGDWGCSYWYSDYRYLGNNCMLTQ